MPRHVLFVDDEAQVLDGLKRMLRKLDGDWEMAFVESGDQALEYLSAHAVDAVVSDLRMPHMDGVSLLETVRDQYPHVARIMLSGFGDEDLILRSVGVVHQFLAKPCDATALKHAINQVWASQDLVRNAEAQRIVAGLQTLPAMPALYGKVLEILAAPDGSVHEVGEVIEQDVAMTAKVLQLVNSAFFGVCHHITSPTQAVSLLGMDTVKGLVLGVGVFDRHLPTAGPHYSVEALYRHSLQVGVVGQRIVRAMDAPRAVADDAFMAGILHDVGVVVLMANFPAQFREALDVATQEHQPLHWAEARVLGTTHAEIGASLLGLWGLPDAIVEAVAYHHAPQQSAEQGFGVLLATYAANALVREVSHGFAGAGSAVLDLAYLSRLDLDGRVAEWRAIVEDVTTAQDPGETERGGGAGGPRTIIDDGAEGGSWGGYAVSPSIS